MLLKILHFVNKTLFNNETLIKYSTDYLFKEMKLKEMVSNFLKVKNCIMSVCYTE